MNKENNTSSPHSVRSKPLDSNIVPLPSPRIYIIVPCLNEEAVLTETNRRLCQLLSGMRNQGKVAEESGVVYVDDGSTDGTWAMIQQFHAADRRVRGIQLAHNAGHQNALMAGLETIKAEADLMVTIDADLQDDPQVIEQMVDLYNNEGKEVVYGVRRQRKEDTFFKRNTARAFYRLMQRLGTQTVYNHADYRLMSRRAVEELCRYPERNLFLRGVVPLLGYPSSEVYYDRVSRFAGESKYPLSKMVNFAVDGITSFSVKPLRIVFALGMMFVIISLLMLAYVLYSWCCKTVVPGWSSLIVSIWFIGGCILMSLGVIGEYIGKIYIETKQRPRYHIQSTLLLCFILLISSPIEAQRRERYEFYHNFPVYADSIIAHLDYPLAWGNAKTKNFKKWKRQAKKQVMECMGGTFLSAYKNTSRYELRDARFESSLVDVPQNIYHTSHLVPRSVDIPCTFPWGQSSLPSLLLIPEGEGPFPAVILLHDHGAHLFIGKEKMIRPVNDAQEVLSDADQWVEKLYGGQYLGDYLAANGYVVLAVDAPMWGERGRAEGADRSQYDIVAGNMMMYGLNLCAQMTFDDMTAATYLASLPIVDSERVACVGFSMGGYRSWMLAALSDEVKAGAAICWMVTTDEQMTWKNGRKENGGFANCIPQLRRYLDYPHIASIACPKPMLFINGKQDKLFPTTGVEKAYSIMHDVWKSQKADQLLETELWDMPHVCDKPVQERILQFLNQHL